MKRFLMTVSLTLLLSGSALAGDIPCDAPAPPPQRMTQATDATLPGEIPTSGNAEQMSEATLSALLSVLGWLVA